MSSYFKSSFAKPINLSFNYFLFLAKTSAKIYGVWFEDFSMLNIVNQIDFII